jgi:hypothetical protein
VGQCSGDDGFTNRGIHAHGQMGAMLLYRRHGQHRNGVLNRSIGTALGEIVGRPMRPIGGLWA